MNLRSLFFLLAVALIISCDVEPDAPAGETAQRLFSHLMGEMEEFPVSA